MSRIGKKPIAIPSDVEVVLTNHLVKVKGAKGELEYGVHPNVLVKKEKNLLLVAPKEKVSRREAARVKALWGLTRTLLFNMIQGVSQGFEKRLEIEGTGYRASVEGDTLTLSVGFSHPVKLKIPHGVACSIDKNVIIISGANKQQVGEFAAQIRKTRKVEPYKGKGIKYVGEYVRRKEGKKVAGATGAGAA